MNEFVAAPPPPPPQEQGIHHQLPHLPMVESDRNNEIPNQTEIKQVNQMIHTLTS